MTEKILNTLNKENNSDLFDGATEAEINDFETKIDVKFPELLKDLYLEINGGYDGGLLEFYSLDKVKNIDDFDFGYYPENKSGENIIWELGEQEAPKCFIKDSKHYYSFMNYNFGGGYWFINLNKSDEKYGEILLLYHHMNEYYKCQPDINSFFKLYTDYCAIEVLLDSEIKIAQYIKEQLQTTLYKKHRVFKFVQKAWYLLLGRQI